VRQAVEQFADYIRGETLCAELGLKALDGVAAEESTLAGKTLKQYVEIVK
jgi:hypothetical protein